MTTTRTRMYAGAAVAATALSLLAGATSATAESSEPAPTAGTAPDPGTAHADLPPATTGFCAFTPMADQTYSTWVGLPPDPKRPRQWGAGLVTLETNQGKITIVLDRTKAPCAVESFVFLVKQGYFNKTKCHRLTAYHTPPYALSVLQCGDPLGTGWGDPGYWFRDEFKGVNALPNWPDFPDGSRKNYVRGTLAMANAGPDTNGSQFFLVYDDSRLRPDYTVFGRVTAPGMAVLDKIAKAGVKPGEEYYPEDGAPALPVRIMTARRGGA